MRKFAETTMANSKINIEIREMLLGHSIGIAGHYYRPTEQEMLQEYLKVVDNLTINEENRLKRENQELKQQDGYQRYVIEKQMKEIKEQNEILTQKLKGYDIIMLHLQELRKKMGLE